MSRQLGERGITGALADAPALRSVAARLALAIPVRHQPVDLGYVLPLAALTPGHGPPSAAPVPHWAVLLVVVPLCWLCIGLAVLAIDRLLRRLW